VNDRNEGNAIGFWKLPCDAINEMWCVKYRESRVGMIDRVSRMCRVVKASMARPARLRKEMDDEENVSRPARSGLGFGEGDMSRNVDGGWK
jgi:hypothetical protein